MRKAAPARGVTGVWNGELGIFVDQPEPISRWIARALLDLRGTTPRTDRDLIDLKLVVGYEVQTELLKEVTDVGFGMIRPSSIYGAQVELDPTLAIPFELRWTSLEEAAVARIRQEIEGL